MLTIAVRRKTGIEHRRRRNSLVIRRKVQAGVGALMKKDGGTDFAFTLFVTV
jgi:hypothetical protein